MFPLRDENPTELVPFITFLLILTNAAVWLFVQGAGSGEMFLESLCQYGAIPGEVTGSIPAGSTIDLGPGATCRVGGLGAWSLLTSMFMHGGWMHLIGNMWFLWVFGNNIEDSMGHVRYLVFYLLTGGLAAAAHIAMDPGGAIPTVGASGAISGVMGAYIVLYPRVRVQTLIFIIIYIRVIPLPAWALLAYWFFLQLVGVGASSGQGGGGVAFWAHVGGFVAGVVLVKLFEKRKLVRAKRSGHVLTKDEMGRWDRW
ncbi:MAG: rhomboid family intramembrane serine protease [Gemmatimonadetes bacterium]|nr:rhomboid family intramembrane serine protease [Gemmatimonadota bacterium]MBT8478205.1 rhomboid family intramembrane serine protease [Gemmatimonadota bacterium]NNK48802.1 rhomboid family intramembrane serine protease [Gemmatimonadota bacterium]